MTALDAGMRQGKPTTRTFHQESEMGARKNDQAAFMTAVLSSLHSCGFVLHLRRNWYKLCMPSSFDSSAPKSLVPTSSAANNSVGLFQLKLAFSHLCRACSPVVQYKPQALFIATIGITPFQCLLSLAFRNKPFIFFHLCKLLGLAVLTKKVVLFCVDWLCCLNRYRKCNNNE